MEISVYDSGDSQVYIKFGQLLKAKSLSEVFCLFTIIKNDIESHLLNEQCVSRLTTKV